MKVRVVPHERRLTELHTAALHVASLGFVKRKLGPAVTAIVDCYGAFTARLATMHYVVAMERCAIERHVNDVRQKVVASTPVLVCTVGSLFRKSALRE